MIGDPFPRARANRIDVEAPRRVCQGTEHDEARSMLGYVSRRTTAGSRRPERKRSTRTRNKEERGQETKRCEHAICTIRLEWKDALRTRGAQDLVQAWDRYHRRPARRFR